MNVRVHKRDFTTEDFADVEKVGEGWGGDELIVYDHSYEEVARIDSRDVTFVEIRL